MSKPKDDPDPIYKAHDIFPPSEILTRTYRLESVAVNTIPEVRRSYLTRTRIFQLVLLGFAVMAVGVGLGAHLATRSSVHVRKLLIVSFDGFRWDYPNIYRIETPFFNQFASEGVKAIRGIKPCFTTETFPNHFSIATGLFEESHGIISNSMYDSQHQQNLSFSDTAFFEKGEPLWVTARRQGLKSGSYFWIGSDLELRGLRPNYYETYNMSVNYDVRIDTVLSWFVEKNLNLGMLYFERPDYDGHLFGVESGEFKNAIKDVDSTLGYMLYKIDELGLNENLNVIVLSDHGMVNMREKIILENFVNLTDFQVYMSASKVVANIFPIPGAEDRIYQGLKDAHPNMTCFKKNDIPEAYHYKNGSHVAPLVAVADEGYILLLTNRSNVPFVGYHGYDNSLTNMHAFFAARGPAFKNHATVDTFNNVDIYSLACHILGIRPAPNNGTLDVTRDLLLRP